MHKLLSTGKTSLLENFVSNKTRRKFKAYLAYDAQGRQGGFEFEPRRRGARSPGQGRAAARQKTRQRRRRPRRPPRRRPLPPNRSLRKRPPEDGGEAVAATKTAPHERQGLPSRYKLLGASSCTAADAAGDVRRRRHAVAGPAAARRDGDPARVLGNVAFYIFVPALLFRTTARLDLAHMPWRTLAAFFVPVLVVMFGVYLAAPLRATTAAQPRARRRCAPSRPASATRCSWASRSPRRCSARAGLAIHVALVSLHALVLLTVLTALVELDLVRAARQRPAAPPLWPRWRTTLRNTIIHPVVLPVLAGLLWNATGLVLPALSTSCWHVLGSAVVPVCLVLIGVSLASYGLQGAGARRASRCRRSSCCCCRRWCW